MRATRRIAIAFSTTAAALVLSAAPAGAGPASAQWGASAPSLPPLTTTCVGKRPGGRWSPCLKFTSRSFGETWLRWGYQDPNDVHKGFGWRHITASHPELRPWRRATERSIAYVTYYGHATGGSGTTEVWEGKDAQGKGWRVVLSARIDRADPHKRQVGVVTAFRIRLR
jgi:hypothetical protein